MEWPGPSHVGVPRWDADHSHLPQSHREAKTFLCVVCFAGHLTFHVRNFRPRPTAFQTIPGSLICEWDGGNKTIPFANVVHDDTPVSHDKYQGYFVLTQVYDFVLGYMSRNEERKCSLERCLGIYIYFCNMDGIYFGLKTIVSFEVLEATPFSVTRTFVVEHSSHAVILCFVFFVCMSVHLTQS